jgi:exodeoxyribonuclease V alpha subunit
VQVLCPMYRGHAGADTINADLQDLLNPGDQQIQRGGKTFREGDKVMQIRNDYDLALFNGDTGRITELDRAASKMFIRFGSRVVEYPFADLDALVPGYAITVHRSQGSEYPAVVIPLATDHYMMLRRNLLYTAITRARQLVVLVGSTKALEMAVRNNDEAHRYSGLADCLRADA